VLVKDGDQVSEGQVLLVMESMKMESKIYAKRGGKVKVFVKVGEIVDKDAVLVAID
jgi:biotin carboxyl carrier protein